MFDIISQYDVNMSKDIFAKKCGLTSINLKIGYEHRAILNLFDEYNFCNFNNFQTIDEFTQYINDFSKNEKISLYKNGANNIKGIIFEIFAMLFLNYFSTLDIIEKNNKIAQRYTFKCCMPIAEEYSEDYGIDLICRSTSISGESKNAVIQVKYRSDKDTKEISSDLIDKLYAQGIYNEYIESFNKNSEIINKQIILFTNADFAKYRPTFEKHPIYNHLLIIDYNTINNTINNQDFWLYFKKYIANL